MKFFVNAVLLVSVLAVTAINVGSAEDLRLKAADRTSVSELIQQLGAEQVKVRDIAELKLSVQLGALPLIREALVSPDPEVKRRANRIAKILLRRQFTVAIEKYGVDLFAQRYVRMTDPLEEEAGWLALTDLADKLVQREGKDAWRAQKLELDKLPKSDFAKWLAENREMYRMAKPDGTAQVKDPGCCFLRAMDASVHLAGGVIITAGTLSANSLHAAIVVAGESVELERNVGTIEGSVVICAGDVAAAGIIDSIVIARGKVTFALASNATIFCRSYEKSKVARTGSKPSKISVGHPPRVDAVKFFEPEVVGIEVESADGGAKVKKVAEDTSFGRAGLRSGDIVLSLDGAPTRSDAEFRRLLRGKMALGQKFQLTVHQGAKDLGQGSFKIGPKYEISFKIRRPGGERTLALNLNAE